MQRNQDREPVGIMGAGVVGGSLAAYVRSQGYPVSIYDPQLGHGDISVLDAADFVFICVPTPYTPGIGFDDRHLLDAVSCVPGSKNVVIKSTVLPGTTELLQKRHRQHRFMFNPEFLREATAADDFINPDRQIVGVTEESAHEGMRLMAMLPRAPFQQICHASEAEMAKYAANSFLAVKVSFANELFDLCDRLRIDYAPVKEMMGADPRIGTSHMDVFDAGYRGYGGKCLPKDSKALLDLARSLGMDLDVLRAADHVNARLRPSTLMPVSPLRPVELAVAAGEQAA
jgi:UDPglucose 6-dehydrogenase